MSGVRLVRKKRPQTGETRLGLERACTGVGECSTHTGVCKVIRCPRLHSGRQFSLHDDDPTAWRSLNTAKRGPKYAPSVPGPSLGSGVTSQSRIRPRAAPGQLVRSAATWCWLRVGPCELPSGSSRAAAVPPSGHSENCGRPTSPEVPQLARAHFPCPSPVS